MDKKMTVGAGVGVVLVLGVGVLVAMNMKKDKITEEKVSDEVMTIANDVVDLAGVNNIQDLMKKGESMECTFDYDLGEMRTQGKYFFDGKNERMKMESTLSQNGVETKNFVLDLSDYLYTWSNENGTMVGYKFPNDMNDEIDSDIDQEIENLGGQEIENYEEEEFEGDSWVKEAKLSCKKWKVDEKMFVVPVDVNFQDMSVFNEQMDLFEANSDEANGQLEDFDMSSIPNMDELNFDNLPQMEE